MDLAYHEKEIMKTYQEMYDKFYGKLVMYEITEGCYGNGVVEAIDIDDPEILYVLDETGQEQVINMRYRDVVMQ